MSTVTFRLKSGAVFEFHEHQISSNWNNVSGIYAFCSADGTGISYQFHYIGQATSFKDRLSSHERWQEAQRRGADRVLAMVVPHQGDRDKLEAQLIAELQPALNKQLR